MVSVSVLGLIVRATSLASFLLFRNSAERLTPAARAASLSLAVRLIQATPTGKEAAGAGAGVAGATFSAGGTSTELALEAGTVSGSTSAFVCVSSLDSTPGDDVFFRSCCTRFLSAASCLSIFLASARISRCPFHFSASLARSAFSSSDLCLLCFSSSASRSLSSCSLAAFADFDSPNTAVRRPIPTASPTLPPALPAASRGFSSSHANSASLASFSASFASSNSVFASAPALVASFITFCADDRSSLALWKADLASSNTDSFWSNVAFAATCACFVSSMAASAFASLCFAFLTAASSLAPSPNCIKLAGTRVGA
mmetsp:Transcript_117294/g.203791  ORF Transcript_117294/g.203791 Transcript_117294/m.203791 type:complete len:315 (+) Transcript_117294:500-1444(+)